MTQCLTRWEFYCTYPSLPRGQILTMFIFFFFSSRRRHTRLQGDWSSDVCSSDLSSPARRSSRRTASCAGEDDAELVAADASHQIVAAHPGGEDLADAEERLITRDRKSVV